MKLWEILEERIRWLPTEKDQINFFKLVKSKVGKFSIDKWGIKGRAVPLGWKKAETDDFLIWLAVEVNKTNTSKKVTPAAVNLQLQYVTQPRTGKAFLGGGNEDGRDVARIAAHEAGFMSTNEIDELEKLSKDPDSQEAYVAKKDEDIVKHLDNPTQKAKLLKSNKFTFGKAWNLVLGKYKKTNKDFSKEELMKARKELEKMTNDYDRLKLADKIVKAK